MTVTGAFLVLDPPVDRLAMLLEFIRPVVADVVIVVDDRTAPETVATLTQWDATLVPFHWVDDFSEARNAALPYCRGDWILHLDPDELPSMAMLDFVRMVDASPTEDVDWQGTRYVTPRGYLFFTKNYFDGIQGAEWEEHWHCRLFRRGRGIWYKRVHEQVMLDAMPEDRTRNTPLLPKAPRSAFLIHSRMNDRRIDDQYVALGERGMSGAAA